MHSIREITLNSKVISLSVEGGTSRINACLSITRVICINPRKGKMILVDEISKHRVNLPGKYLSYSLLIVLSVTLSPNGRGKMLSYSPKK